LSNPLSQSRILSIFFNTVFLFISHSNAPAFAKASKDFLFIIGLHLFKKSSKDLKVQWLFLSSSINSATSSPIPFILKNHNIILSSTAAI
jgi:hypothetical protein